MSNDQTSSAALDKAYRPGEAEARQYARWEQSGAFECGRGAGQPYAIVIPPPNVTGTLHMGHALNNTLDRKSTRLNSSH